VTEASARIIAAVSAEAISTVQPHSVCNGELCCATTVERTTAWWSSAQVGGPSVILTAGIHYKIRRLLTSRI